MRLKLHQINTTTMDTRKVIVALFAAFSALCLQQAVAQSSTPNVVYLELNQLTVGNYPTLVEAFKSHPDFELMESCVPAKVVSVRVRNTQLTGESIRTSLQNALTPKGFTSVTSLNGMNDSLFLDRCKTARTRP
jgi:hypothetical protein